jgi:hypothetical protein
MGTTMFDRLVHFWMPVLFLVLCELILLPQTSARVMQMAIDVLYGL